MQSFQEFGSFNFIGLHPSASVFPLALLHFAVGVFPLPQHLYVHLVVNWRGQLLFAASMERAGSVLQFFFNFNPDNYFFYIALTAANNNE